MGANHNTAVHFFHTLGVTVATKQQHWSEQFCGHIELDESYFGGFRKGKRGPGTAGKVPVFKLLKRGGKVYTQVIADAQSDTVMSIIE